MASLTFAKQHRWLVTGAAGFIGSHLCEFLLKKKQCVVGIDNFITGTKENIIFLESLGKNFTFCTCDICDVKALSALDAGFDFIFHQAALGSVPRSVLDPETTHNINVNGTLNVFNFARQSQTIQKVVYASSSSVYGDIQTLPKKEDLIGQPLSPYACTKHINELYAHTYAKTYHKTLIGLRYFNVFGQRQRSNGPYAAVIPKWCAAIKKGDAIKIFGDGQTTRDFCFVDNVVRANMHVALSDLQGSHIYNVGCGRSITLSDLAEKIKHFSQKKSLPVHYHDFRPGDIRHSLADIQKISQELNYRPSVHVEEGLKRLIDETLSI